MSAILLWIREVGVQYKINMTEYGKFGNVQESERYLCNLNNYVDSCFELFFLLHE